MMTPRKIDKIDRNRHTFGEGACEVIGELCVEWRRLMTAFEESQRDLAELKEEMDALPNLEPIQEHTLPSQRPPEQQNEPARETNGDTPAHVEGEPKPKKAAAPLR